MKDTETIQTLKTLLCLINNSESLFIEISAETLESTLTIISRQKAEIERLTKELKETTEKFNCQQYVYVDLSNIIKEKIAEIERLKKLLAEEEEKYKLCAKRFYTEAIKEFAEKVDKLTVHTIDDSYMVWKIKFDNLVKEMVGESNV